MENLHSHGNLVETLRRNQDNFQQVDEITVLDLECKIRLSTIKKRSIKPGKINAHY